MAVQEDNYQRKTYYRIYGGKVVREWYKQEDIPEGLSNVKKRVTQDSKKEVWYKPYIFKGILTGAYKKYNDKIQAMQFNIEIDNDSILTFGEASGYFRSFMMSMGNFPTGEEIEFRPYNFTDQESGKKKVGITILSEGKKIQHVYTKDNPNGLPQPKKRSTGKLDWGDQEDFLFKAFEKWHKGYFSSNAKVVNAKVVNAEVVGAEPSNDVPF